MDIEAYIGSGILESYALGLCSPSEKEEVEQLMETFPEVKKEVLLIQDTFEKIAWEVEQTPPPDLKAKIWDEIQAETPVISLAENSTKKSTENWMRVAAIATLFIATASAAIVFYNKQQSLASQLAESKATQQEIESQKSKLEASMAILTDANTTKVILAGVPTKETSKAVIFWNKNSKKVMLHGIELPTPPADKQYQLWALMDGKPIDAGVFDVKNTAGMIEMKNIENSQAFAITLEPKGGSPTPHLEDLFVIGNI